MIQFVDQIISKKGFVDLHIHTNDSYGEEMDKMELTPEELLESCYLYSEKNNSSPVTFAITDHNSIDGVQKVDLLIKSDPKKYQNIHFIPGCEFTCSAGSLGTFTDSKGHIKNIIKNFHMLAYGFNPFDEDIQFLCKLHSTRKDNSVFYTSTNKYDEKITMKISAGAYVLAIKNIMKDYGYDVSIKNFKDVNLKTRNIDEQTYIKYLMNYITKFNLPTLVTSDIERQLKSRNIIHLGRLDCMEVMDIVEKAGGYCVLAHPYLLEVASDLKHDKPEAKKLLKNLLKLRKIDHLDSESFYTMLIRYVTHVLKYETIDKYQQKKLNGIVGMEVLHSTSTYDKKDLNTLVEIAEKNNLYMTGGSDSHGTLLKNCMLSRFVDNEIMKDENINNIVMTNNLFASNLVNGKKFDLNCYKSFDEQIKIILTNNNLEENLPFENLKLLLRENRKEVTKKKKEQNANKNESHSEFNRDEKQAKLERFIIITEKFLQNINKEMNLLISNNIDNTELFDRLKNLKILKRAIKNNIRKISDYNIYFNKDVTNLNNLIDEYNLYNVEFLNKYTFLNNGNLNIIKNEKTNDETKNA